MGALSVWAFSCAVAGPVSAQVPEIEAEAEATAGRPASIGRIARHFDFEERGFNAFDVPLYWFRAQHDPQVRQREGFPITNLGRLDYDAPAASGIGSVRLDTSGGSTSLRLEPSVVPVFPSVQYAVGAMVRVGSLNHARPRLAARLLDENGQPVAGTSVSRVIEPPRSGWPADFTPVLLKLPEAPDAAVSIQVDLELVQPQELQGGSHNAFELWYEDYSGSAWFDDIVIVQLPTASLATSRPSNAFLATERPEIVGNIRDLSGDAMKVDLYVRDMEGAIVAHRREDFGMGAREFRWEPPLSRLGWYEAELVVSVGQTPMLRLFERFVWLPDFQRSMSAAATAESMAPSRQDITALADRRRFGLVVPGALAGITHEFADELVERSGGRSLLVTAQSPAAQGGDRESLIGPWNQLAERISTLRSRLGVQTTIMLTVAEDPAATGHVSLGDQAFSILEDGTIWDEVLVGLIDRLAESVERWHIGPLGSDALAGTAANRQRLATISQRLHRLAPDPMVGVPWSGRFDPSQAPLPSGDRKWSLTVQAPAEADGDWIADATRRMATMTASGTIAEATIVLEPLDREQYGRRASVSRLAEQVLSFWDTLEIPQLPSGLEYPQTPLRLALSDAWDWQENDGQSGPSTTAALAAWRGMSDRLAGMRRIYEFETIDGVRASLYEPILPRVDGSGGLLVLRAAKGLKSQGFEWYLGEQAVRVFDVFGNLTQVDPVEVPEPSVPTPRLVHRIDLSDLPVFVDDVDTDLLMFVASLRLEPDLLPAIDMEHPCALVMQNPWPGVTSVRARVVSPGGFGGRPVAERAWEISPRLTELLLEGGQERRTPMNIRFRRSEPAGRKSLGLELDIRGENSARRVRVDVPFRIGLDYIDVTATARRSADGVLVTVEVRNLGERPVTLEATAIAPGVGRQRAMIPQLTAGATARRELLLRGADLSVGAERIVLAIEDVDIGARLNYQVDVP